MQTQDAATTPWHEQTKAVTRRAMQTPQRLGCKRFIDLFDVIRSASGRISVALTHRNFRILWMGALTSSIGTWMQKVAQAWLIVTMTGSRSAFFLGLDSFFGDLPLLLFTMIGGVFADRRDRRHMILMSQIIQMLVAMVLAALIYAKRIHIAQVLGLSFIVGCVRAFGGPAYESLLPTLVGKEHLPNAIALNSTQFNLAQVIGPFLAGAALAAFGMVVCFGLNSISFLFVIAAILSLRDVHVPPMATESMVAQFRSGLRFVQGSPNLVTVMVLGFFVAFLGVPLLTFLPVITRDVFHRDVGFYTQLMTFLGAGAVMGALVVAWLGKNRHMGRTLLISLTLFGTIIIGFGLSRNTYLSALILFMGGSLFVMCSSLTTSLAQLLVPPEFRGRVLSIYLFAFLGGSPLGGLASGWLVTRFGSAPLMLVVNGTALMFVALCFLIHGQGLKDI
ncbi:MAG TPA: MFS transporter [Candidatus Sulfotelmatobacter sp.]|jgi:MFS family permease